VGFHQDLSCRASRPPAGPPQQLNQSRLQILSAHGTAHHAAGIAIAAMYSAAPALARIRQEQEEALIAAYAGREAAAETAAAADGA
jgi:hypothetical protein